MSELSVIGPNRHFWFYKVHSPEITKIVEEEQFFVKEIRQFLTPTCVVTGMSWNELVDKEKYEVKATDGKVIAICSD